MKPYPKYKDSGIEWIGEIPAHWDVKPLKYMVAINKDALPETVSHDQEIHYIDIGGVDSSGNVASPESMLFKDAPSRARRVVRQGDTIVSTVRTYLKAIAYIGDSDPHLIASTGFAVLSPAEKTYSTYLYYLMSSQPVVDTICAWSTGVSYPAIAPSQLASISLWIGDIDEQQSIATYLDRKTKQIDGLIEKKQNQIDLLREQRTAVINEAVTKGLNPKAKMKDSGIEWIGEIPEHWNVSKVKWVAKTVKTGTTPPSGESKYFEGGVVPWYTPADFHDDQIGLSKSSRAITEIAIDDGECVLYPSLTVMIVGIGATLGKIGIAQIPSASNQQINSIVLSGDMNPYFFAYFLFVSTDAVKSYSNAATLPILNQAQTKSIPVPVPPREEQDQIVEMIKSQTSESDTMIAKEERLIELLQEYRTSLISEVVTGKVDVRNEN